MFFRKFQFDLSVSDNGTPDQKSATIPVSIRFIDLESEPFFVNNDLYITINEHEIVETPFKFEAARYNVPEELSGIFPIHYNLLGKDDHFVLDLADPDNLGLKIVKELDKESPDDSKLVLNIVASKSPDGTLDPDPKSILTVSIDVGLLY